MAESTEAQVIKQFIPTLVVAVCDSVQGVSDKCLAKGLISESTSKRVLDPRGGTSEERARTLIHSVHTSTKTDRSCFQIFLEVLDEELPYRAKEKVLSDMKKELSERAAMCKAVIPVSQASRPLPHDLGLDLIQQQSSFLGQYEDAVSKLASAATQKSLIEETLKSRSEESGRLRTSLDMLSQSHDHERDEKEIVTTRNRLSACETEMAELRERVEELESVIEEEGMRARRGRNTIRVQTKRLFEEFSKQSQIQFSMALEDKEEKWRHRAAENEKMLEKHKEMLAKKEQEMAHIRQKIQEEMDLKMKDLEHKIALQEKELKIKELELKFAEVKIVESNPKQAANETNPTEIFNESGHTETVWPDTETDPSAIWPANLTDPTPDQETNPTAKSRIISSLECQDIPCNETSVNPLNGIPTLVLAMNVLSPLSAEWVDIAIGLNIDYGLLDEIKAANSGNSVSCLHVMLSTWLKRVNPPPSWSAIAEAVENSGHADLASQIRAKYC